MKFFLMFCLIYSVTLYADNPKKLNQVKNSIKEVKKALQSKSEK